MQKAVRLTSGSDDDNDGINFDESCTKTMTGSERPRKKNGGKQGKKSKRIEKERQQEESLKTQVTYRVNCVIICDLFLGAREAA